MRSAVSDDVFSLDLDRTKQGLALLGAWVDRIAAAWTLPPSQEYALRLCLEEAVANVVMHGRPAGGPETDRVALKVCKAPNLLEVVIEDACGPFDPVQEPPPRLGGGLADCAIGGLGIHLMRQFTRSMQYSRIGPTNRLTLTIERRA